MNLTQHSPSFGSHIADVDAGAMVLKICTALQSRGKKSLAVRMMDGLIHDLEVIVREDKLTNLEGQRLETAKDALVDTILRLSPFVAVKSSKRGGANVKIPTLLYGMRSCGLGIRLLVEGAIARAASGIPLGHALLVEVLAVLKNENCTSLTRYRTILKDAKANRMFRPRAQDDTASTSSDEHDDVESDRHGLLHADVAVEGVTMKSSESMIELPVENSPASSTRRSSESDDSVRHYDYAVDPRNVYTTS